MSFLFLPSSHRRPDVVSRERHSGHSLRVHRYSSCAACKAYLFILPRSVIKSRHSHITPVLYSHFLSLPSCIVQRARIHSTQTKSPQPPFQLRVQLENFLVPASTHPISTRPHTIPTFINPTPLPHKYNLKPQIPNQIGMEWDGMGLDGMDCETPAVGFSKIKTCQVHNILFSSTRPFPHTFPPPLRRWSNSWKSRGAPGQFTLSVSREVRRGACSNYKLQTIKNPRFFLPG
jgi:hypothetical protein